MAEQTEPTQESKPAVLRYVGSGSFVIGVPARDLTADDLDGLKAQDADAAEMAAANKVEAPARRDRRWLIKSGLYEPVAPAKE